MKQIGIMLITIVVAFSILIFIGVNSALRWEDRYTIVKGKITHVNPIENENGQIKYLVVTFSDGEIYRIVIKEDVDLTVNSNIILELRKGYERTFFWEDFEPLNNYYSIEKIIKIP